MYVRHSRSLSIIGWAGAEVLEHGRVGRVAGLGPLALRQVELEEEDLLELLGAAEVELVADVDVDLGLEAGDLGPELGRQGRQPVAVDRDTGRLHAGEDRDERQLDLGEQAVEVLGGEGPLERRAGGHAPTGHRARPGPPASRPAGSGRMRSSCSATMSAMVWLRRLALSR